MRKVYIVRHKRSHARYGCGIVIKTNSVDTIQKNNNNYLSYQNLHEQLMPLCALICARVLLLANKMARITRRRTKFSALIYASHAFATLYYLVSGSCFRAADAI